MDASARLTRCCHLFRCSLIKKLPGLRLETDQQRARFQLVGFLPDPCKDLLVPQVHTVEIADRHDTAAMAILDVVCTPDNVH